MIDEHKSKISLYERLGGETAIDSVTMAFYAKIYADERVSHFFKGIDLLDQIQHLKSFLTYVFGGHENYTGRSLRAAHAHLNIQEADFNAVAELLHATLVELEVNNGLIGEVMAIVGSTKSNIIV